MYVDTNINEHQVMALLDMEVNVNYMSQDTVGWMGLASVSASRCFKGVNGEWTQLVGEAREVPVSLRQWTDTTSFSMAPIDDYEVFFGMCFLDQLRPIMVPYEGIIFITQGGKPYVVKVCREAKRGRQQLKRL